LTNPKPNPATPGITTDIVWKATKPPDFTVARCPVTK
jgi:hypothetical protein